MDGVRTCPDLERRVSLSALALKICSQCKPLPQSELPLFITRKNHDDQKRNDIRQQAGALTQGTASKHRRGFGTLALAGMLSEQARSLENLAAP